MKTYSIDLRERVVRACETSTETRKQIAERFSVSTAWIRRLLQRRRDTGSLAPLPHGGGMPPKYAGEELAKLKAHIHSQSDATLEELRERTGALGSIMAVHRAIERLGGRVKKSRCGQPNRTGPTSSRTGKPGASKPPKKT